jgi:putative endonuclease
MAADRRNDHPQNHRDDHRLDRGVPRKPSDSRRQRGRQARHDGSWAETIAVWRLRCAGYRILARNWRCTLGEIDIVARKGRILAIVEVKSRSDLTGALAALGPRQQARLVRAAQAFQAQHRDCLGLQLRFDAVAVGNRDAPHHIWPRHIWPRHIKQAWRPAAD